MVETGLRVLVVGAGIAGLAVARTLRLAGFRPDVVEALPGTTVAGAGIYLPGNGARALRALGLHEAVTPVGAVVTRQRFCAVDGAVLAEIDAADLWAGVGECRGLPRADLHRILLSGAGGAVTYERAVTGLTQTDGAVTVSLSGGEQREYDLVIGADGRRSAVRRMADLGGPARAVGQIAYRSVVCDGAVDTWTTLMDRDVTFLAVPIGGRRTYCYVDEPARGASPPADPLARVRDLLADFGGPVPGLLEQIEKVQVATLDEVELPSWHTGRVVLIGDAAHACPPHLAQGAAMALEDAVVLAQELRGRPTVAEALAAFEARRLPRTSWVLAATRRRDRARGLPSAARHALLRRRGTAIFRRFHTGLLDAP